MKRGRRSYSAGEWSRHWVRGFPDPKTGMFQIESRENRHRLSRSLKYQGWPRAKRQADELATGFVSPEFQRKAKPELLTLGDAC